MFNFNRAKVDLDNEIGSGASGTVYPYQKDPGDKKWVVKNAVTRDPIKVREHVQEIALGFSCDHPSVLPVKGFFIEIKDNGGWDIFIKLPWMRSSLSEVLTKARTNNTPIAEEKIVQYFYEITQGLQYLHDKGIAHRDIKPDNILLDETGAIKIADFGLGVFQAGESSYALVNRAGTCSYAAPENLNPNAVLKAKNLFRADLWSLGILLFELCTLMHPKCLNVSQLSVSQSFEQFHARLMEQLGKIEGRYCKKLIQIILGLLRLDPLERKSLKDVQGDLLDAYGDILQTESQSQEVQTEFDTRENEILEMTSNIENLQEELRAKDAKLLEVEKHYKEIVASFESKLIELGIELEFERNMRRKEAEERSIRIMSNLDRPDGNLPNFEPVIEEDPKICATAQEFKQKWESYFIIKDTVREQQKISIEIKNDQEIKQMLDDRTIKRLMADFCESYSEGDLKYFKLELKDCFRVSNTGLKNVVSLLCQNFPGLRDLALSFTGSGRVSDEGLRSIATYMGKNLDSLKTLELNFDRCPNMSDRGLNELAFRIGSDLRRLKRIILVFNSLLITDSSVKTLGSEIASNLLDLDVVDLFFKNCSCTQKGMESARKLFDNIQGVQVSLKKK